MSHPPRAVARIGLVILVVPLCLASVSYGQGTFEVVKAFDVPFPNGAYPAAGVVQAPDGSLFGTTRGGGAYDRGSIFKIDLIGTLTTLYSFTGGSDGASPDGGVILATDGNLYGMTSYGGTTGYGTIFKLDLTGTLTTLHTFAADGTTTLHSFAGGSDGVVPVAGVIQATDGNFYGTTSYVGGRTLVRGN